MKRLEKLTPEQEARLPEIRKECLDKFLEPRLGDHDKATEAMARAYQNGGLEPPKHVVFADDPMIAAYAAGVWASLQEPEKYSVQETTPQVPEKLQPAILGVLRQADPGLGSDRIDWRKSRVAARSVFSSHIPGQYGWSLARYIALIEFGVTSCERMIPLIDLANEVGWSWLFDDIAICTERHTALLRDDQQRLHCEPGQGPALAWPSGYGVYAWHGTRIPKAWIEDKDGITPAEALRWENIEQRRCAFEILGWDRILDELDAKVIDKDENPQIGTLVEVTLPDETEPDRFIRVECGTGRSFALPVPPDMRTALEANAWTYDVDPMVIRALEART